MKSTTTYRNTLLLSLCALVVLAACSTRKNNTMSRAWHRLLARDNAWFNANLKLNEINDGIEKSYVYNFDEVLPVFVHGTPEQAKAAIPEIEKCIEKCNTVIKRHSMEFEGKQKNKWIADAYFVIGKSHYTKQAYSEAERRFSFMGRKFKGHELFYEAKLWGARCAIQMEQYAKAQSLLDEVKQATDLPKHFPNDQLAAVQADLDLKRGKVDDAILGLQRAVQMADKKNDRVRWAFILAQLYDHKGRGTEAIAQFRRVTQMNPSYEMDFHARIYQALAFDAGSSKSLRQKLNRMLRDEKHKDHFDMIHYALADLDLKENNDSSAIAHLKTSSLVNTTDTKQKAKTFLKLADVYFEDRIYVEAQKYYDSTRTVLAEDHKRYEEVANKAEVLTELVEQLAIIHREDSLQGIAAMPEEERLKLIRDKILEREHQEEARKEEEARAREVEAAGTVQGKPVQQGGGGGSSSGWYFYNPQSLSRGMTEFKKKWGPRINEDDWRRKDKAGSATQNTVENEEEENGGNDEEGEEPSWKKEETYLRDLPKDSTDLTASNERICEALYKSGMIYKEKLADDDNGVESFEILNARFDNCRYTPESHYQLYRIYLQKEKSGNFFGGDEKASSKHYADIILERWPNSEFARLVRDPNVLASDEERKLLEVENYRTQYEHFKRADYLTVISACDSVLLNEPNNHLYAKHHLLKAMCIGNLHMRDSFIATLTEVKNRYPGTEEAKGAEQILINLQQQAAPAGVEGSKPSGPAFRFEDGKHYFAMVVPNGQVDVNTVKAKLTDFNSRYFPGKTVQVQASFLDPDHQVVQLTLFDSKEEAMTFYDLYLSDKQVLAGINDKHYPAFAISPDNYSELYKTKDVEAYSTFFASNYLE
ncbi:MAG: tetratricopeptide repeat protein [Flavobacteriales bacterium]